VADLDQLHFLVAEPFDAGTGIFLEADIHLGLDRQRSRPVGI